MAPARSSSGRRVRAGSPPCSRTFPYSSSKQPCEMWLVREATLGGNLAQRLVGRQHPALRPLHQAANDVLVRLLTDALTEGNIEVGFTKTSECCEILVADRVVQIRV